MVQTRKFSEFVDGGILQTDDIVAGLDSGINTIFDAAYPDEFTWNVVDSATNMENHNGYVVDHTSGVILTLPATADVGDWFLIANENTGLFTIAQNAGQTIRFAGSTTTTGLAGSLSALSQGDFLSLICTTTNTTFMVGPGSIGNFSLI